MSVESTILAYFDKLEADKHHRYRSWEHCFRYFQRLGRSRMTECANEAAIHLGFYLASWGMYRGSSFLLRRDYTVHCGAIMCLADARWSRFWTREFGAGDDDDAHVAEMVELRKCIGTTYREFGEPTDTLVTKVMLGTLGCSPACDTYFLTGFGHVGYPYSYFNERFVGRLLTFCRENLPELRRAQSKIEVSVGTRYPLMKLVDMYFFQTGVNLR